MKITSRFGTALAMAGIGALLIFVFQNCGVPLDSDELATGVTPVVKNISASDLTDLYLKIESLNQQDLSCQSNDDCGSLALGSKACGGPQKYVVVSARNANLNEMSSLAQQLADNERAYNEANGIMSNCMMAMEPEPKCVASRCQ